MKELKVGDRIGIEAGGEATVSKELGRGGQGIVYLVTYNRKEYALKWYFVNRMKNADKFRNNLAANIRDGAPGGSDKFLWPKYLTVKGENDEFGYLMDVVPKGYDSFTDIYNGYRYEKPVRKGEPARKVKVTFASLDAMITAAINIVKAFRCLHLAGKSYQDLNDGGFFININNGDVVVCDCDNVAPDGENFGIGGMPGFMAPEIVRGQAKPDVRTDRYSLAVVLFRLFFRGDPLEGNKVLQCVVLTEENDFIHYGKDPVFVYDPANTTNRPVKGVHDNVIKLWKIYPEYILEAFTEVFTQGIKDPNKRLIERKWQELLIQLRTDIIHCSCGKVTFATMFSRKGEGILECKNCHSPIYIMKLGSYKIPLYEGLRLYACQTKKGADDYDTVTGLVVENKIRKGLFGIKNMSKDTWKAKYPNQLWKEVAPGGGVPIWKGLEIDFGDGIHASVIL